jgi:hypothetical protein
MSLALDLAAILAPIGMNSSLFDRMRENPSRVAIAVARVTLPEPLLRPE